MKLLFALAISSVLASPALMAQEAGLGEFDQIPVVAGGGGVGSGGGGTVSRTGMANSAHAAQVTSGDGSLLVVTRGQDPTNTTETPSGNFLVQLNLGNF